MLRHEIPQNLLDLVANIAKINSTELSQDTLFSKINNWDSLSWLTLNLEISRLYGEIDLIDHIDEIEKIKDLEQIINNG